MKKIVINGCVAIASLYLFSACSGQIKSLNSDQPLPVAMACQPAWNSNITYDANEKVSDNGVNYIAAYSTQRLPPSFNHGPASSGQVWIPDSVCAS